MFMTQQKNKTTALNALEYCQQQEVILTVYDIEHLTPELFQDKHFLDNVSKLNRVGCTLAELPTKKMYLNGKEVSEFISNKHNKKIFQYIQDDKWVENVIEIYKRGRNIRGATEQQLNVEAITNFKNLLDRVKISEYYEYINMSGEVLMDKQLMLAIASLYKMGLNGMGNNLLHGDNKEMREKIIIPDFLDSLKIFASNNIHINTDQYVKLSVGRLTDQEYLAMANKSKEVDTEVGAEKTPKYRIDFNSVDDEYVFSKTNKLKWKILDDFDYYTNLLDTPALFTIL
jgi:hypothetical protein